MTGLNLEGFLHLLRADVGAWASLGVIALLLALMTWTSWGSRRALRKCLVLSVLAHLGLVFYGSTLPHALLALNPRNKSKPSPERIREIRVVPVSQAPGRPGTLAKVGQAGSLSELLVRPQDSLALAEARVDAPRPPREAAEPARPESVTEPPAAVAPEVNPPVAAGSDPSLVAAPAAPAPPPAEAAPSLPDEVAAPVVAGPSDPDAGASPLDQIPARRPIDRARPPDLLSGAGRMRPGDLALAPPAATPALPVAATPAESLAPLSSAPSRPAEPARAIERSVGAPAAAAGDPDASGVAGTVVQRPQVTPPANELRATDVRRQLRPQRVATETSLNAARRRDEALGALALNRATPRGLPRLPEIQGAIGGRPLSDVPEVYRSRLDPNRTAVAQRAGATPASEQAVERALAWLARHQDADGSWDAGISRHSDGTPVRGDDDYTVHCPPGDPCTGECIYWEADTALTGLSLLAYLGSGYTHLDGKYTENVGRGLDFLIRVQKPDGDLRGMSRAVGMYCHAMATLALCEAYALTGDVRLRAPVEKAVGFISRSRARDGLAWRYAPGAIQGDTSILGWVVMALKSAKVAGVAVPPSLQSGSLGWLGKVASGSERGLASYQPGQPPTPTMTAEAWVCRQFLGVGGPGPMSDEAAQSLLEHLPPGRPGRDGYNLYYWYYGTLAMYQHGGADWTRWNNQVRDQVVRRQRLDGHRSGSWDPDDSEYGARGGRIYCTALATLTLEVYYRFLRLYDEPDATSVPPPPPAGRFTRRPARDPS